MSLRRGCAAALLAAALALAGCASGGSTTTTVIESGGGKHVVVHASSPTGGFDPEAIYRAAAPSVVEVDSILGSGANPLSGGSATGAGFVVSSDGEIVTNAHVVTDAGQVNTAGPIHPAKHVYVQFADRNRVPAEIVGFDPNADVALLKVDPDGLHLVPLQLATDEDVQVGQPVAAIGSPFFEARSLSVGVVSATDREIDSLTQFQISGAIQTDAAINPGNSGGPLLDANAHVIGIDQQIASTSGGGQGVGFAIPVDLVKRSLDQLRQKGHVDYAYLGVKTQPVYPQLADKLGLPVDSGALVSSVVPGGPADSAGIQGGDRRIVFQGQPYRIGGDVIVAVGDHKVVSPADVSEAIQALSPGETVTLHVIRDGKPQDVGVKLGSRPE